MQVCLLFRKSEPLRKSSHCCWNLVWSAFCMLRFMRFHAASIIDCLWLLIWPEFWNSGTLSLHILDSPMTCDLARLREFRASGALPQRVCSWLLCGCVWVCVRQNACDLVFFSSCFLHFKHRRCLGSVDYVCIWGVADAAFQWFCVPALRGRSIHWNMHA